MTEQVSSDLAGLLGRYPLPAGVPDAVLNKQQLAEALAVSVNTVSAWLRAGMPAIGRGGPRVPYQLQLSQCYAWSRARAAGSAGARHASGGQERRKASELHLVMLDAKLDRVLQLLEQHGYGERASLH